MGLKSRGNYPVTQCVRFDCANRGANCSQCIGHRLYRASVEPKKREQEKGGR
jgi:hypothetical protein